MFGTPGNTASGGTDLMSSCIIPGIPAAAFRGPAILAGVFPGAPGIFDDAFPGAPEILAAAFPGAPEILPAAFPFGKVAALISATFPDTFPGAFPKSPTLPPCIFTIPLFVP